MDFLQIAGCLISIHTLHTEGDAGQGYLVSIGIISIHTLHTEGDRQHRQHAGLQILISIHTLHTEGDSVRSGLFGPQHNFNPHPPHGG